MTAPEHVTRAHALHNASSAGYWMNCGVYIEKKLEAEAQGLDWNPGNDASLRGQCLHDVMERGLRTYLMGTGAYGYAELPAQIIEGHVGEAEESHDYTVTDEDREQLAIAFDAALNLTPRYGRGQVLLEQKVPLSHEPESVGYVDLGVVLADQRTLIVCDYKFGRTEVQPLSLQNKIYAANLLRLLEEKKGWTFDRVILGIIQPQLYREAIVSEISADELEVFRQEVERVVGEQMQGVYRPASDLDTCTWCPWETDCAARAELVRKIMVPVEKAADSGRASKVSVLSDEEIETIRRNKAAIEKVLEDCNAIVRDHPERFPNWTRQEVQNARSWNPQLGVDEIVAALVMAGATVDTIKVLATPAKVRDACPQAASKVEELTVDGGSHIRMRYGAPKDDEPAPPKRPAARKKASAKAAEEAPAPKGAGAKTKKAGKAPVKKTNSKKSKK